MKRRAAIWRTGFAACVALALAVGSADAAGPPQWILKSGSLWVSDRTFVMALSVKKNELKKEDAAKKAAEQFGRLRQRLLLAAAGVEAKLDQDPAVRKELEEYRAAHLVDLWLAAKVGDPARAAAREQASRPGHGAGIEAAVLQKERARLMKKAAAEAGKEFPAEIDEAKLTAASRGEGGEGGEGGEAVVARTAGREVSAAAIVAGMAKVEHPSDNPQTALRVASTVLEGLLDRARYTALAEREGFAKRPDFIDDLGDRVLRVLAEAYTVQKIHPAAPQVTEADLEAEYERSRGSLKRGEEREIFEILVPTREAANAVAARLAAGADFAAEAAAHSVSPTKERDGFFGFVQKGEAIPALDAVIATLKTGQVGPVVQSPYGYHVLRCASVQQGRTPPLVEVRPALERRLLEARRAQALAAAVARLEKEIPVEVNETRYQEILKSL